MRTPEGGSSYRVRGHQEGAELFSLFTFYVNTPKGVVVIKQVPVNTNLSLRLVSLPPRGVLQRLEEQGWSGCGESGGIEGQSQYHRLQHRSSPSSPVTVRRRQTRLGLAQQRLTRFLLLMSGPMGNVNL